MTDQEKTSNAMINSARLFELMGWGILLACSLDSVLNLGILAGELTVFVTSIAATLLIIGIIIRKQAHKAVNEK